MPASLGAALGLAALAGTGAHAAPVLRLPGAGPVTGVAETLSRDGFDQSIRFGGGDGANMARLGLRNRTADLVLAFPINLSRPNRVGIEAEIRAVLPGQAVRVLTSPHRNAYGPVGMAVGADCLYAWQWIDLAPAPTGSGRTGLFGAPGRSEATGAVSLRVRLCRTASASLADLIAAVERMSLDLSAPVREPAGTPMRKAYPTRTSSVVRGHARAARAPARSAPQLARTGAAEPHTAAVKAEPSERRFLAPSSLPQQAPQAPAADGGGGGKAGIGVGRYITDALVPADAPSRPATALPNPAGRPVANEVLPRDLPPQAYQPPARSEAR